MKRTIAFFDILGSKAMIQNKNGAQGRDWLFAQYQNLTKNLLGFNQYEFILKNPKARPLCQPFIISDTIILCSPDDSPKDFIRVIECARFILQHCSIIGLPVRGSIAYGQLNIDNSLNVVVGEALIDAYELEQKQNWLGAVLHENAIYFLEQIYQSSPAMSKESFDNYFRALFLKYPVPLKNQVGHSQEQYTKELYAINMLHNFHPNKAIEEFAWFHNRDNDSSIQLKIDNTIRFLKSIETKRKK
jgi:hypothetical protein